MPKYSRIRDLREDADLTQKQVADSLYMHLTQYRRYETGEREIPLSVAIDLSQKYGVSVDYIAGISNSKNQSDQEFTPDEQKYIDRFRSLTDTQKGRIMERIDMLLTAGKTKNKLKYTKHGISV